MTEHASLDHAHHPHNALISPHMRRDRRLDRSLAVLTRASSLLKRLDHPVKRVIGPLARVDAPDPRAIPGPSVVRGGHLRV